MEFLFHFFTLFGMNANIYKELPANFRIHSVSKNMEKRKTLYHSGLFDVWWSISS